MAEIKTTDFFSSTPPVRTMGTECEYEIHGADDIDAIITPENIARAGYVRCNQFMGNASKLYPDINHLEYATAESMGPKEAVAADISGRIIIADLVNTYNNFNNPNYDPQLGRVTVYRTSGTAKAHWNGSAYALDSQTKGYHQNYLVPRLVTQNDEFKKVMLTHLATRLYAWNGMVTHNYGFSQKLLGLRDEAVSNFTIDGRTTEAKKVMLTLPAKMEDDVTINKEDWIRVEVRFADPLHSHIGLFLSIASNALVLRLLENRYIAGTKDLDHLVVNNPRSVAGSVSKDIRLKEKLDTAGGKKLTALDIQEGILEKIEIMEDDVELPEDEILGLKLWRDILDRFRRCNLAELEFAGLDKKLDCIARYAYLRKHTQGSALNIHDAATVQRSFVWDRVSPNGGADLWWNVFNTGYIDPQNIEYLCHNPTSASRAQKRGRFIANHYDDISSLSWSNVMFDDGKVVSLGSPI